MNGFGSSPQHQALVRGGGGGGMPLSKDLTETALRRVSVDNNNKVACVSCL